MKILFYDTKNYDRESFQSALGAFPDIAIEYTKSDLDSRTAALAEGFDAVCAFVNSDLGTPTLDILHAKKVSLILMRCAGFNNVDLDTAKKYGMCVMRVPGYSPEAVAEHAMALALASNRRLHKAYNKVRENDFSLSGLMGFNFYQKTAGIIGTGKIGAAMCRICHGFGMKVIAYDVYQNEDLKDFVTYVSLDQLLSVEFYNRVRELAKSCQSQMIDNFKSYYALTDEDITYIAGEFKQNRLSFLRELKEYNLLYLTNSSNGYQVNVRCRYGNETTTEWRYCILKLSHLTGEDDEPEGVDLHSF